MNEKEDIDVDDDDDFPLLPFTLPRTLNAVWFVCSTHFLTIYFQCHSL
jgi:hypothetical protein